MDSIKRKRLGLTLPVVSLKHPNKHSINHCAAGSQVEVLAVSLCHGTPSLMHWKSPLQGQVCQNCQGLQKAAMTAQ